MKKLHETVLEHCKHEDCSYRKTLSGSLPYCDYISVTGMRRGCKISKCTRYTTEKVKSPPDDWPHREEE